MIGLICASLIAAVGSSSVFAGDAGNPGQACDGNTQQMVECLAAQTAQWDKRLNAAYRDAMDAAPTKQREQLRVAQRLWIHYRDANCLYYALGEGSIARLESAACMLRMTRGRTNELTSGGAGPDNPGKEDRD